MVVILDSILDSSLKEINIKLKTIELKMDKLISLVEITNSHMTASQMTSCEEMAVLPLKTLEDIYSFEEILQNSNTKTKIVSFYIFSSNAAGKCHFENSFHC